MKQPTVIVVDDFYEDPHQVRGIAINADYASVGRLSRNFPGIESSRHYYTDDIVARFRQIVRETPIVNTKRNAFGRFRLSRAHDQRRTRIHFDNTKWSAIVYLTLNEYCTGGTDLVRHCRTGLDGPPSPEHLEAAGYQSLSDFDKKVVGPDTMRDEAWQTDVHIGMRFNRLVLIRGSERFHGSTAIFGNGFDDGRLTQVFFFDTLEARQ